MIVTAVSPTLEERQILLETLDPLERLRRVIKLLASEVDVLELEDEIHTRAQNEVDRTQREFYLREQMKAIQTELGEGDIWTREIQELRTRVDSTVLPEEVQVRALKEVDRLSQMPPMSPEVGIIRTYVEWILDLPWSDATDDNLDVRHAGKVLERDHYGLPKAKERILEYIAVRSLKPKRLRQPILCFIGHNRKNVIRTLDCGSGRKFVRYLWVEFGMRPNARPPGALILSHSSAFYKPCAEPAQQIPCSCSTRLTSGHGLETRRRRSPSSRPRTEL
jgi:ATP-dependent Lon protease